VLFTSLTDIFAGFEVLPADFRRLWINTSNWIFYWVM